MKPTADSGRTPLMCAAASGDGAEIERLIGHGAAIGASSEGWTALTYAVAAGRLAAAALLLAHGADPNTRDEAGRTALMQMVGRHPRDGSARSFIPMLIRHGADPAAITPDGCTLPAFFVSLGRLELVEILDVVLACHENTDVRRRLLDRLSRGQRDAWMPRSCAAAAAESAGDAWGRSR